MSSIYFIYESIAAPILYRFNEDVMFYVSGEHIDYSGYAVLPMAVEQDIVIATAADKNSTLLRLSNTNPEYQ